MMSRTHPATFLRVAVRLAVIAMTFVGGPALAQQTPAEILAGDAANTIGEAGAIGCKDKARAAELVAARKKDDQMEYIRLWAEGMQDQSCRGFVTGLGVSLETADEDGWDCILPIDDPDNRQCFWIETGLVDERISR